MSTPVPPPQSPQLVDVSRAGGLSLTTVALIVVFFVGAAAPGIVGLYRLDVVERDQVKHIEWSAAKSEKVDGEIHRLDTAQQIQADRYSSILASLNELKNLVRGKQARAE